MIPVPPSLATMMLAAGTHTDARTTMFFVQVALLILCGRLLGEAMQRINQPAVVGQLLAGIILGPSAFGALWPGAQQAIFPAASADRQMLSAVAELGVLMLLLLTGMETDLGFIKRLGRSAVIVSAAGILIPFVSGYALGEFLPTSALPDPNRRFITSLFLATALSISSVKIVAAVLRESDFLRRNLGQIILAAALLDDTIGWTILAFIGGMAAHGQIVVAPLLISVIGTAALLTFCFTIGHRWVAVAIRWTNDRLAGEMPVISLILLLMIGLALLTNLIGVHTVLGAFLAGIMVGRSPILTQHIEEQLRGLIVALFMPVFFGLAGLSIDLRVLAQPQLFWLALLVIGIASFGKLAGCYVGSRLAHLHHAEALSVGLAMNARGSTEIILATIGLSMGALDQRLFTIIVLMAVVTTLMMPPLLTRALRRVPLGEEEKARLEKEEAENRDCLPGIERLLVAVDFSEAGRRAGRLAGWLLGARGLTATVLPIGALPPDAPELAEPVRAAAKEAVERVTASAAEQKQNGAPPEDGTVAVAAPAPLSEFAVESAIAALPAADPTKPQSLDDTIEAELAKGYGMLFLGLHSDQRAYPFTPEVEHIARSFKGVFAIFRECSARSSGDDAPLQRILLPISGTEHSRIGAEVAVAIAKGCGAEITALHVSAPPRERDLFRHSRRSVRPKHALLADVMALGAREGVRIHPRSVLSMAKESMILEQARDGQHQLIVLGTKAWTGDQLHLGESASVLLEQAVCPLLLVKS